jgi:hypothetical protein
VLAKYRDQLALPFVNGTHYVTLNTKLRPFDDIKRAARDRRRFRPPGHTSHARRVVGRGPRDALHPPRGPRVLLKRAEHGVRPSTISRILLVTSTWLGGTYERQATPAAAIEEMTRSSWLA